jgi:membrane protease subunit HflK
METRVTPPGDHGRSRNWRPAAIIAFTLIVGSVVALMGGAVVVLTGFYTIQPDEVGVVLRFGRHVRTTEPGLNFKLPAPIEEVLKVPIQRQRKQEFGFRTFEGDSPDDEGVRDVEPESLMITGDLNVAVVEWITQYRISDIHQFLFGVRKPEKVFRDLNESVMGAVVGDRSIDEVITIGRLEIEDEVKVRLQELCDRHQIGIVVDQVVLQDVNPPEKVKPSFDEVNKAHKDRERAIRKAHAEMNERSTGGGS